MLMFLKNRHVPPPPPPSPSISHLLHAVWCTTSSCLACLYFLGISSFGSSSLVFLSGMDSSSYVGNGSTNDLGSSNVKQVREREKDEMVKARVDDGACVVERSGDVKHEIRLWVIASRVKDTEEMAV
ncbi:hypothetical protein L1887_14823 [Cichorium endivia]|nr:hypothetical protein L1887_14823 [Cichorium endivia]